MFFKKIILQLNDFFKRSSLMRFWLLSYVAVLTVILILVGCAENIFIGFVVDDTIMLKTEEINTFADKMEMLTEECKLFAARLAVDDNFKNTYMSGISNSQEHLNIKETALEIKRTMTLVDDFFVYLKKDNMIINSLGHVCSPDDYYNIYFKESSLKYDRWSSEIIGSEYSGYHVFDMVSRSGLGTETKFCYALPTKILNGTDATIFTMVDSERYSKEIEKVSGDESMSVLIYDENSKRYFEKGDLIPDEEQLIKMEESDGFYETKINGKKVVMNYVRSNFASWKYLFVVPYSVFWARLIYVKYIGFTIIVLLALLGITGIYLITKYNYKTVADIIKKIETNFESQGRDIEDKNEYSRINKMIDAAAQLNDKVEKQEKQVRSDIVLKLLLGLINNDVENGNNSYDRMFKTDKFMSAVFCTAAYEKLFENETMSSSERFSTVKLIITNIFTELMEPYGTVDAVVIENIVFLFSPDEKYISSAQDIMFEKAQETVELINKYFELNIVCGLSTVQNGIANVCMSYREALSALNAGMQSESYAVKMYSGQESAGKNYYYPVEQAQYLIMLLNKADHDSALGQIKMIIDMNSDAMQLSNLRKALITDIAGTIMKAAQNIGYDLDAEKLMDCVNASDNSAITAVFETYVDDICSFVNKGSLGHMDTMVDKVNAIIADNYTNTEFNVNMIADMLNINANYLSAIYKRKTDMNILDNIRALRVKEAKRLIVETKIPLENIAKQAGFGSITTFNRVFKKFTGISPGIYRNMNKQ
ncbi:MAG: AraC family transcriptional regulator [Clostridia bacterium]|nr:AraC family transcriptional regulator [Clostridia bacterium]